MLLYTTLKYSIWQKSIYRNIQKKGMYDRKSSKGNSEMLGTLYAAGTCRVLGNMKVWSVFLANGKHWD